MSYILDALTKNQAEQSGDGVALKTSAHKPARSLPLWLTLTLVAVLAVNAAVLVWLQLRDDQPTPLAAAQPELTEQTVSSIAAIPEQAPIQTPIVTKKPTQLSLAELPDNEQSIYRGLNFTTHLYTDVASECVVRVDGISLRVGDSFKGLRVIEITETGVVFEERRKGHLRHIEVPVLKLLGN